MWGALPQPHMCTTVTDAQPYRLKHVPQYSCLGQVHDKSEAETAHYSSNQPLPSLCRYNITAHDLETKMKKLDEFLSQGRQVAVSVTYETRQGKWKEQYPKAVQACCAAALHAALHVQRNTS